MSFHISAKSSVKSRLHDELFKPELIIKKDILIITFLSTFKQIVLSNYVSKIPANAIILFYFTSFP